MTAAGRREDALHAGARIGRAADDLDARRAGIDRADPQPVGVGMRLGLDHIADGEGRERRARGRRRSRPRGRARSAGRRSPSASASVSRCSFSQERVNFIAPSPPTRLGTSSGEEAVVAQPAQIGLEEGAQIGDAVFQHGDALDPHAEGEALLARRIDAAHLPAPWDGPCRSRGSPASRSPAPIFSSPPAREQPMSTSADGSVKGKKLGRKRTGRSSTPKKARQNSIRQPFRWPIWVVSSITSPSTWWNIGVWVMSLSQR